MKYIKLFENYNNEKDIKELCRFYDIEDYTINDDDTIDVHTDVDISDLDLKDNIDLKFNRVDGHFNCGGNELTDVSELPRIINGNLLMFYNKFTTLEDGPEEVNGEFSITDNDIYSLKGFPKGVTRFECFHNPIHQIWMMFRDVSKIELFNFHDCIREPETYGGKPILIIDKLNDFLSEIGKGEVDEIDGYECI